MKMNYILTTFRNLIRERLYTVINLLGLAIGLSVCLLILSYIVNELDFEGHHLNGDNIYRVSMLMKEGDATIPMAPVMAPLGPALASDFPEVQSMTRFHRISEVTVSVSENTFQEESIFFADPSALDIFTFPLLKGNRITALKDPFSILITEKMAKKYFGDQDPIDKILTIFDKYDFRITGVIKNIPVNTQLNCDLLASISSLKVIDKEKLTTWSGYGFYTYVLLKKSTDHKALGEKISDVFPSYMKENSTTHYTFFLQPLQHIYLHSKLSKELSPQGNLKYIYLFSVLAILILAMANFNFINLTVSRTTRRVKEVGVRKVLGAMRKQLIVQFLGESLAMAIISMILGLAFYEIARGILENFLGRPLAVNSFSNWIILSGILLMIFLVGVVAGSYPAFYISRFHPVPVLKNNFLPKASKFFLRRMLLIFQFMGAVALIFSTLVIYLQIQYGTNKDMGFSTKNILLFSGEDKTVREKQAVLKEEILKNNGVVSVSFVSSPPAVNSWEIRYYKPMDDPQANEKFFQAISVDEEFISTFEMKLTAGRNFSGNFSLEKNSAIINETAVKKYNIKQPVGYKFLEGDTEITVIGVVKDFHGRSLHSPIYPVILLYAPERADTLAVKLHPYQMDKTLASLKSTWGKILPHQPFIYSFLEEEMAKEYEEEQKIFRLFIWSSLLAIIIACLGMFALISISGEQRTKEVGIRKALGASIRDIILLLSREFMVCVLVAILLSWPIAYLAINKWLENFSYRYPIGVVPFFLSALIAFIIAIISIAYQTLKITGTNPVKALRYE